MQWEYNDGGREAAGLSKSNQDDHVTRAVAIAMQIDYATARAQLDELIGAIGDYDFDNVDGDIRRFVYESFILALDDWRWVPAMRVGASSVRHMIASELPAGRLIVKVSKQLVAVIDGVLQNTTDERRDGSRMVYGWYEEVGK